MKKKRKENHLLIKARNSQAYNSFLWVLRLGEFAFGCPTPLIYRFQETWRFPNCVLQDPLEITMSTLDI